MLKKTNKNAHAQIAHLFFANTQSNVKKQKSYFLLTHSNVLALLIEELIEKNIAKYMKLCSKYART